MFAAPIIRLSGSRYLTCLEYVKERYTPAIEVDIKTMATSPIADLTFDQNDSPFNMLPRNNYIMCVSRRYDGITIYINAKWHSNIEFMDRHRHDKAYYDICSRWYQQFDSNIYIVGDWDMLCRTSWIDIEQSESVAVIPKLIDSQVEDYFVTRGGNAIVDVNSDLKLPGEIVVESKTLSAEVF